MVDFINDTSFARKSHGKRINCKGTFTPNNKILTTYAIAYFTLSSTIVFHLAQKLPLLVSTLLKQLVTYNLYTSNLAVFNVFLKLIFLKIKQKLCNNNYYSKNTPLCKTFTDIRLLLTMPQSDVCT